MEKKKYRSIYFKDENLWVTVEKLASDEERSVNAMVEILVKRGLKPNIIVEVDHPGMKKAGSRVKYVNK